MDAKQSFYRWQLDCMQLDDANEQIPTILVVVTRIHESRRLRTNVPEACEIIFAGVGDEGLRPSVKGRRRPAEARSCWRGADGL